MSMEISNFSNIIPLDEGVISFIYPIQQKHVGIWSFEEEKLFENALAFFDLNSSEIFEKIAVMLPGKTIEQVKYHFDELVNDVKLIEDDGVGVLPPHKTFKKKNLHGPNSNRDNIVNSNNQPTKKGARWTKEEHERFLVGLSKYGKGDWRSISRNCVLTKTPTQVASHAQKYFIRLAKSAADAAAAKPPHKSSPFQDTTRITASPTQPSWVRGGHASDPPGYSKRNQQKEKNRMTLVS